MRLFTELNEEVEYITEARENGEKEHFIHGIFLQANKKNRNGRIYPIDVMDKEVNRYVNEVIDNNGVCCFSQNFDNILQWSHYADSHKGVCLVFDILKDPCFFDEIFPVDYRNEYREYNVIKNFDKFVNEVLLPKYKVWDYEAEIRSFSNEIGLKKFNQSALTKIIFGCNTSQEVELKIINSVSEYKYPNIEFLKAVRNNKEYKLDFELISSQSH